MRKLIVLVLAVLSLTVVALDETGFSGGDPISQTVTGFFDGDNGASREAGWAWCGFDSAC